MSLTRKRFYRSHYVGYLPDHRKRKVQEIVARFRGQATNLLDIGSGDGEFTRVLMDTLGVADGHVIEISPTACEMARARHLSVACLDLDEVERLPFDAEVFDMIHAGQVIEHVFNTDLLLSEIRRILRPKGVCIISTPNLAAWYNRLCLLLGFQPINTAVSLGHYRSGKLRQAPQDVSIAGAEHVRVGAHRAWSELFAQHGLTVARTLGVSVATTGVPLAVRVLDGVISSVPSLASVLIFELRKKNSTGTDRLAETYPSPAPETVAENRD